MGYNREFEINEAQIADYLQNAVEKVRSQEDADILNQLQKLFKKNVPLTMRKYVIAYMLKESLKHYRYFGNNTRRSNNNERNERNNNSRKETKQTRNNKQRNNDYAKEASVEVSQEEEHPHHPRVEIAPEDATSIFISIGKNRRVFPRDLVGILIAIAGIDRERIGDIKVLANYSFVQLYTEDAQTAIDKLNGYDYRGRKLAVSYSRQKGEDEKEAPAAEKEEDVTSPKISESYTAPSITEEEMAAEDAAAYAAAEKAAKDKEPFGL